MPRARYAPILPSLRATEVASPEQKQDAHDRRDTKGDRNPAQDIDQYVNTVVFDLYVNSVVFLHAHHLGVGYRHSINSERIVMNLCKE
jgi:hypothetical protein